MHASNPHVIEATDATFDAAVVEKSRQVPVVVDFWAPWCGPCRVIGPVLERLAAEAGGGWLLAKVNTDENPGLGQAWQITGIPAVKAFRGGRVVAEFVGAQPESHIREFLKRIVPAECETQSIEGEKKRKAGRFDEAEAAFRKALESDRGCAAAHLGLARLRADQGRDREAAEQLEAVPPGTPERREADTLAARLRLKGSGSADHEALKLRVEQDPADLEARNSLGLALAGSALYEEALGQFIEIVRQDRGPRGNAARKAMLDIFQILGGDHPLVLKFRAELGRILFE